MSWRTALRLATAGGFADRARIGLTAAAAAAGSLVLLAAAAVAAVGPGDGPYTTNILNEPGLRPGVVVLLLLLCLPLLVFVGQCTRIGTPARDRRFAALRLTGATPHDVVRVAAAETGLSAALGALLGSALFVVLRVALDRVVTATYTLERPVTFDNGGTDYVTDTFTGPARPLPTDVWPSAWVVVLTVVLVPLSSAAFTVVALRRVTISPFGLIRREQRPPRRALPLVLLSAGLGGTTLLTAAPQIAPFDLHSSARSFPLDGVVFGVLLLLMVAGLLLGTSAYAAVVGARLAGSGHPALLLAGRRLLAAPAHVSRANSALLVAVLTAALLCGVQARLDAPARVDATDDDYRLIITMLTVAAAVGGLIAVAGLLVGTVESIVSRRQVIEGMSAAGIPLATVRRAVVVENLAPLVPAILLAATAGILAARGAEGTRVLVSTYNPVTEGVDLAVFAVHVPWVPLAAIALSAVTAAGLATAASLPLLRASADHTELRAG